MRSWRHNHSIEEPAPTITTKDRLAFVNMQYGNMDKMPPYLICSETGAATIFIEPTDTPAMMKIKEFMVLYRIVDIKMRMLRIPELKQIMGFPENYTLIGTQTEQKKFIGNAVEVTMAKVLCEALCGKLIELNIKTKILKKTK